MIEKFMKNNRYKLIDNEGGGDCFFAVVRDAFEQVGKFVSIDKLRDLLLKKPIQIFIMNTENCI